MPRLIIDSAQINFDYTAKDMQKLVITQSTSRSNSSKDLPKLLMTTGGINSFSQMRHENILFPSANLMNSSTGLGLKQSLESYATEKVKMEQAGLWF